jgi:hypothetical protein
MTIDALYQWINFMANKQQSGAVSPDEFNLCLDALYLEPLKVKLGLPELYQVGQPTAPQSYQVSQTITDDVQRFILEADVNKNSQGFFTIPTNYVAFSSIRYIYVEAGDGCNAEPIVQDNFIEAVTDGELAIRTSNTIVPPTLDFPICAFYQQGIKVFPKDIDTIKLTYVRKPNKPFRNYTITPNDENIFNPIGSVDLEYPDIMHNDFAVIVAKYFGINLKDGDLINFATTRQMAGQ